MKKVAMLLTLALCVLAGIAAESGEATQIGKSGDWGSTIAATAYGGMLYTVEEDGTLYETNPSNGKWKKIATGYENTVFLAANDKGLFTIEDDGTLYSITPSNGKWKQVGKTGDYSETIAADGIGKYVYNIESDGALYRTDVTNGKWTQLGKEDFAATTYMTTTENFIYTVEEDGTFYEVSPETGAWRQIGKSSEYKGVIGMIGDSDLVYTVEEDGNLWVTDPAAGTVDKLSEGGYDTVIFMADTGDIVVITDEGDLYRVEK